jgi:hypothetical protein
MVNTKNLPTFRVQKRTQRRTRSQKPPAKWPKHLKWPGDIFEFQLYNLLAQKGRQRREAAPAGLPLKLNRPGCCGTDCPVRKPNKTNLDSLCACAKAPWHTRHTSEWFETNISLQHIRPDVGISAVVLTSFTPGTVLGEYTGTLIPAHYPTAPRRMKICVVVQRKIREGEEITVDYGVGYWKTMGENGGYCACGKNVCRDKDGKGGKRAR